MEPCVQPFSEAFADAFEYVQVYQVMVALMLLNLDYLWKPLTFLPILGLRGEYLGLQGWGFFKDVEHYNEKSRTIWIGGSMLIQQYPIRRKILK
jgi:hypothetical protein